MNSLAGFGFLAFVWDSLLALAICNDFVCLKENEKKHTYFIRFLLHCCPVQCGAV